MNDKYSCFEELTKSEIEGLHYQISLDCLGDSAFVIVAPHGGTIEPGSGEIARAIASNKFAWYLFESKRIHDESYVSLHITSHLFDEPQCLGLVKNYNWVVTIHGCNDSKEIVYLGGLESQLISSVAESLDSFGIPNSDDCKRFPGTNRNNLCNKGCKGKGLQVEVSVPLREPKKRHLLVKALRKGLEGFLIKY